MTPPDAPYNYESFPLADTVLYVVYPEGWVRALNHLFGLDTGGNVLLRPGDAIVFSEGIYLPEWLEPARKHVVLDENRLPVQTPDLKPEVVNVAVRLLYSFTVQVGTAERPLHVMGDGAVMFGWNQTGTGGFKLSVSNMVFSGFAFVGIAQDFGFINKKLGQDVVANSNIIIDGCDLGSFGTLSQHRKWMDDTGAIRGPDFLADGNSYATGGMEEPMVFLGGVDTWVINSVLRDWGWDPGNWTPNQAAYDSYQLPGDQKLSYQESGWRNHAYAHGEALYLVGIGHKVQNCVFSRIAGGCGVKCDGHNTIDVTAWNANPQFLSFTHIINQCVFVKGRQPWFGLPGHVSWMPTGGQSLLPWVAVLECAFDNDSRWTAALVRDFDFFDATQNIAYMSNYMQPPAADADVAAFPPPSSWRLNRGMQMLVRPPPGIWYGFPFSLTSPSGWTIADYFAVDGASWSTFFGNSELVFTSDPRINAQLGPFTPGKTPRSWQFLTKGVAGFKSVNPIALIWLGVSPDSWWATWKAQLGAFAPAISALSEPLMSALLFRGGIPGLTYNFAEDLTNNNSLVWVDNE